MDKERFTNSFSKVRNSLTSRIVSSNADALVELFSENVDFTGDVTGEL